MAKLIPHKVSRDYLKLVFAVVVIVFSISSFFVITVYKNNQAALESSIEQRAFHLDSSLIGSFNYIIYLMDFLGRQISSHGSDLKYVESLYRGFRDDLKVKDLSSWSMFDWLTPDKSIRATSVNGILEKPVSLADRPNLKEADKTPNKVFFNKPTLGKISNQWIIPVSRSVTDEKGKKLGYINLGVTISGLLSSFEKYGDNISYTVFTDQFFQITNPSERIMDKSLVEILKTETDLKNGYLPTPIVFDNVKYVYYYKSSKYPFIFILGYNPNVQNMMLLRDLILPLTIFLFLGIIALILSYMLYYRVIKPISYLGEAAQKIAKEKDINIVLKRDLPIEIINLANQLNNINIYKKQLLSAKKEIEAANSAKTEFLSATAHELRSPLNAIIGFSGMIKEKIFKDDIEKYSEYAADIEQSGKELLEFISDLLDVSKSENGNFAIEKEEWLDVRNIIRRAIKLNISRAYQSHININTSIAEDLPRLYADGRRIRQVMVNLISNSIKYSGEGTNIEISAKMRGNKMAIVIADQGFGMSDEQILIALKKWGQVKNQNFGKVDSYGLGLPLAKYLSELHGAEFTIDSEPGNGTNIIITFPEERVESVSK